MEIAQIVAVGLISVLLAVTIKEASPQIRLLISICASVLIFFMILPRFAAVIEIFNNFTRNGGINGEYIALVIKIIGIAYIAELGAQICTDAGESAIASKIELAGKVLIMLVSAPILLALLETIHAVI